MRSFSLRPAFVLFSDIYYTYIMAQEDTGKSQVDIIEVVRLIFDRALTARASDVHIDPSPTAIRIRFRIDGVLVNQGTLPLSNLDQILTRLKVLADLDISSLPTPQDGHFEIDTLALSQGGNFVTTEKLGAQAPGGPSKSILDVRISIFPTVNGDAAVCRLLNRSQAIFPMDQLGVNEAMLKKMRDLVKRSYGMVLVTGPVGSGKTTTLYSILEETVGDDKNIVTLEDPVEYHFNNIRQIQMHPDRGMTFAVGMKSVLRQDPDVIMIGEIRDAETAEYAVRASLVGRIVFSTVHSNTSIGTIARLIDMDIERSMIAYALNGVISTRLVRKNCPMCRVTYNPGSEYLTHFGLKEGEHKFMKGLGCEACGGTGYSGRTGIFEVLEFDNTIRTMIVDRASMAELDAYVRGQGMKTLTEDALEKVFAGVTTLESAAHVI